MRTLTLSLRPTRFWMTPWVLLILSLVTVSSLQAANDVGYRDFSFGSSGGGDPTGEKPQSKLWWNDGFWWASMWADSAKSWHIFRLNISTQVWEDTGTAIDNRRSTKADALWDGLTQKLYVVSNRFNSNAVPDTDPTKWARLYRYSYNSATKTYTRDKKFPVKVTQGKEESVTLAKDSTGQLWVTYTESSRVMINHSLNNDDLTWGTPFVLPLPNGSDAMNVAADDISAIIAFGGNKIGVMWSNQLKLKFYFSVHVDGDADNVWQPEEVALPANNDCTGKCGDDHINLKTLQATSDGRVFAAIKTSVTKSSSPLTMLLVRGQAGTWSSSVFGLKSDDHTRPIVLLDEGHGRIFMFATSPGGGGAIYYKTSDINNISFPPGKGAPFIQTSADLAINNATSTKQSLNTSTGLVVLASDQNTRFYLHNYIDLTGKPTITSFTPSSGPVGTVVTIKGFDLTGVTAVDFNGAMTSPDQIVSEMEIRVTVPAGATTGKISVIRGADSGVSRDDFTVTP